MTRLFFACFHLVLMVSAMAGCAFNRSSPPTALRCEYLVQPTVIEERTPRFSWELRDPSRGARQTAYEIHVATTPQSARSGSPDRWNSGKARSPQTANIEYAGAPLLSGNTYYWTVRTWDAGGDSSGWSEPTSFGTGLFDQAAWSGAKWIGDPTPTPDPDAGPSDPKKPGTGPQALPAPMLRKEFSSPGNLSSATLYISALGVYEARINGRPIGDHQLAPEWTDYNTRVQYQGYDVTRDIESGPNAIAVTLGDGWYAGRLGMAQSFTDRHWSRAVYGRQPRVIAMLVLRAPDGAVQRVITDSSWRSTIDGPIRSADLLDGEVQDARMRIPGWDRPGFVESSSPARWAAAAEIASVPAALVPQVNEPIRVLQERRPVSLSQPTPGAWVFDLGQNMAGRCRVRFRGQPGAHVTLRHAEAINDDGTIYTTNLRGAPQVDHFTLSGDLAADTFEPRFTYHGFRFVEITGDITPPTLDDLKGIVIGSSSPMAGEFDCSSDQLNRLWSNILWTQHANMMSVPTDCPQRDERLGWTGDILSFGQNAMFNKDMAGFITKWMQDIRDAQADDGRYADIAPHPYGRNQRFTGVPAWGDVGVFLPWEAFVNYGDTRLLDRHFQSAKRWVDWVYNTNPDLIWRKGRHNDYNDWLNGDTLIHEGWPRKGAAVPNELFATAFFARSVEQVADMAGVLGRSDDEKRYHELHDRIKAAFASTFISADGAMPGDTQAGYVFALNFNLAPPAVRPRLIERLIDGIHHYDNHLSTGFHSSHRAMIELTRADHADLCYQLILDSRFPSWGYSIANGATTIWERWDGYVKGRGFQDPGMNSLNHWALGSVGEWMYRVILGINPDPASPGYSHFLLAPVPGGGLSFAKGSYHSIRGTIRSEWRVHETGTTYAFTIPPNTTATLRLPALGAGSVRESHRHIADAPGITLTRAANGVVEMELAAGSYSFEVNNGK